MALFCALEDEYDDNVIYEAYCKRGKMQVASAITYYICQIIAICVMVKYMIT